MIKETFQSLKYEIIPSDHEKWIAFKWCIETPQSQIHVQFLLQQLSMDKLRVFITVPMTGTTLTQINISIIWLNLTKWYKNVIVNTFKK